MFIDAGNIGWFMVNLSLIQTLVFVSFAFARGYKALWSFINDLPISTAVSRLNYWLINSLYQFMDWLWWKAVKPRALRDPDTEVLFNKSILKDGGAFLVNEGLRCLMAHLQYVVKQMMIKTSAILPTRWIFSLCLTDGVKL